MNPIQVVFTLGFGLIILGVLRAVRANQMSRQRSLFWILLWTAGLSAVWFPESTNRLARVLGVTRGADAVLYLAIGVLSVLVFRLFAALERQDQAMTRLVSELALVEARPRGEPAPPTPGG